MAVKRARPTAQLSLVVGARAGASDPVQWGAGEWEKHVEAVPGQVCLQKKKNITVPRHETSLHGTAGLVWCFHPGTIRGGFVKHCWERRAWQGCMWPAPGSWDVRAPVCCQLCWGGEPGSVPGWTPRHTSLLAGRDATETALPQEWAEAGDSTAVRRDKPLIQHAPDEERSTNWDWFQRDHEQVLRQGACNLPQLKKQVWIYCRHDWSYPGPCSLFSGPSRWLGAW